MDDIDKTIVPRREHISSRANDVTMPGKRDRKPDGRFAVGDLIMGRYKVLAKLGQGGMGVVYKCFDETAGIEIALKALPPELSHNTLEMEDIKENFQLIAKLVHQHIAISKNLECDNSNGNYYLIMECCEGEDLRRWIKRKRKEGQLKLEDVLPIIQQVADALDYAHSEKIIHRDIKPGNIMIDSNGKIKVLDFGLAAQIHTSMTRVSMAYHGTSGTGPYMAPEQWRGRAQGAPADQYALAVMTYEMLAGHLPFESTDASVLRAAVLNDTPEKIADIPKTAQAAIKRAMSKEPWERFASCSDFAAALAGKKIKVAKKQSKGGFPKWAAVLIIATLLGAGGTGYYFFDRHQKEQARLEQPDRKKVENKQQKQVPHPRQLDRKKVENKQQKTERKQEETQKHLNDQHKPSEENKAAQKIKEESYKLHVSVKKKKADIDAAQYDRGQTFGKYLDILSLNWNAADRAEKNNDFATAITLYHKADKAADWIINNARLRKMTANLLEQTAEQKEKADKFNSAKYAADQYKAAESLFSKGKSQFENGDFQAASINFNESVTIFRQAKLAAEKAERDRQAKLAAKKAERDRQAKPAAKKTQARNQTPSLKFTATVNGESVPAKVKLEHRSFENSNFRFDGFIAGEKYSAILTFNHKDNVYIGKVDFVCDWYGERELHVKLEKERPLQFIFPGNIPLQMIRIPKGAFIAGSPASDLYHCKKEQQQKFTLHNDFWLGKFEITQQQWKAVMNTGQFHFIGDTLPADYVSWKEAMEFCEKLNHLLKSQIPRGYKFDLPTSIQWEYAARGGNKSNGYRFSGSNKIDEVGWYKKNAGSRSHKVGLKKPNELGLYDMSGNVAEWCKDADSSGSSDRSLGALRFYRGGSWIADSSYSRLAYKDSAYESPNEKNYIKNGCIGFRIALVPDIESVSDQRSKYDNIKTRPVKEKQKYTAEELYRLALKHESEKKLTAKSFFKKAFDAGYYDKDHKLGHIYEQDNEWEKAVGYYESVLKKHNDNEAALQAALIYLRGLNGIVDHEKGKQYLETAAEMGNAKAMFNLGCCYAKFRGSDFSSFKQSRDLAVKWLKKAQNAGISQSGRILKLLGE